MEDNMQGKRTRALDSRGRPVPGLYVRDGRFIAGFQCPQSGRWRMETLAAKTLTAARRERSSLVAALREHRLAAPAAATFADLFNENQAARDLSNRTRRHEQHLLDRHLASFKTRRVQTITTYDVAKVMRDMRLRYSEWTRVAVYRILAGSFALAVRRGVINRSPVDGLAPSEKPKQRNKKDVARLNASTLAGFVNAGTTERWRSALGLAAYAGLRLGEVRALHWSDIDFEAGTVTVRQSMQPDGTLKEPKTEAGRRTVPMLPTLRHLLIAWMLRSPHARPSDLVVATADGKPIQERNLRRVFATAKAAANIDIGAARLSMNSLRHSYASVLATDLALPATTLARVTGHTDPGFTLRVYARDSRDDAAVVADVLTRAAGAGIGAQSPGA
jgi:integrase